MPSALLAYLRRHHLALLALFVALGGTSYAAASLARNSVGAAQIKTGAVGSSEVRDGSLLGKDFKAGELPRGGKGDTGAPGISGANGAAGAAGRDGAQGPPGPTASTFVSHDPSNAQPPVLVTMGTTLTQVMSLEDGTNGGLLQMPFAGRILIHASITLDVSVENTFAVCMTKIAPAGGAYDQVGKSSIQYMPVNTAIQLSLVAGADRPAGTYNVQVACQTQSSGATLRFLRGNMTVLATARP